MTPGQPVFTSTIYPSDIHIHPNFDLLTLANNIAVVEFYKTIDAKYTSYIAVGGIHDGTQDLYVRRGYDELTNKWKTPEITTRSTDDAYCTIGCFACRKVLRLL
ncbi:hypothetical protein H4R99_001328 [Coemansia sp. RSA 1722]|nr:hypothetical protein H4R99_001328 [Coemansia sp. RSA 1722]